ncbi:MAG: sulfatase-like hydrolase/transferase [Planctomycetes bacterium]|nr:sulfatase-like hydrolase/transferase [Planctomycetota bacterium]
MVNPTVMKRREFMHMLAAGAMGLSLNGCRHSIKQATQRRPHQPNIVYIIADDMGWRDIGYHGSEIRTPNLDRLAGAGRVFDQHYVMPTCTPTRVGLLSGQYPSRYGILGPDYGKVYDDDTVTLAEALKRKGYATHISGKWHMGSPPEYTPMKYGFTSSYGYFAGQIDPYTHLYKTGIKSWHRNDRYLDESGHATDLITDDAVRVIKADHEQPFFLYVAYSVPHSPLKEPEAWLSLYPDIEEPSRQWFAASVTHMDDGIGKIVDALDKTGLRQDTLLVFVSDNGGQESWRSETQYNGEYATLPHTVLGNNLPLREWKGDCYEGGIRVPALVNWPGKITAGHIKSPVHIVDWMPTLCHLTGAESKGAQPCDGQDIWPQIMGETDSPSPRTLYWKTGKASAVRQGDWKLILFKKGDHCELFNLAEDPYEKNDLASEQSERVLALKAVLTQIASRDRDRVS